MRSDQTNRPSSPSRHPQSGQRRFSIVEMAVVAVIVVLLVAAVFPVRAMVRFQKEKQNAYDRARSIEFALRAFEEEYKKLPIDPLAIKDDFFETTSNGEFMKVLQGVEHPLNPLKTQFYIDPIDADATGDIRDPWGNLYYIRIDSNSDKYVDLPKECADDVKESQEGKIRTKVIVWSKGREVDGAFEGAETWIKSWDRP